MIEFEHIVSHLEKLYSKEKSLRNRVFLESALNSLKDYYKSTNQGEVNFIEKKSF